MPVMNLPARIELAPEEVVAVHWMITPRMKSAALLRIAYLREMISARKPV